MILVKEIVLWKGQNIDGYQAWISHDISDNRDLYAKINNLVKKTEFISYFLGFSISMIYWPIFAAHD